MLFRLLVIKLIDEHYRVRIVRCPESGIITEERWENHDRLHHRLDGPALINRDRFSGHVTSMLFLVNGEYHRADGEPAQLEFDETTGVCTVRAYFVDGRSWRPDGLPHVERIDPETGILWQAEYWDNRPEWDRPKRHRVDGPALITYDRLTGEQTDALYYVNGRKRASLPQPSPQPE